MRPITDALRNAAIAGYLQVRLLVRCTLPSGAYNASDEPTDFAWDGNAYKGFGQAMGLDVPPVGVDGQVDAPSVVLAANDPSVLATFFEEDYRASPAELAILFRGADGRALQEWLLGRGVIDYAADSIAAMDPADPSKPAAAVLKVALSPQAAELDRVMPRFRSDADQKIFRDPADRGFEDVGQVAAQNIYWGQDGASSPAIASPGGLRGGGFFLGAQR